LILWLDNTIDGIELQSSDRNRIAAACLDLAMEHQKAIVLLVTRGLFGSAFSLLRIAFEAYVRGVWLHRCATPAEISCFERGEVACFAQLLSRVEAMESFENGILSAAKQKSWRVMNDFTHSGYIHAVHRNRDETIEPDYSAEMVLEALGFVNAVGLLSVLEAGRLAQDETLVQDILAKSLEFWEAKPSRRG
jgi:hypothetical protein